jgi:hypothetical protein
VYLPGSDSGRAVSVSSDEAGDQRGCFDWNATFGPAKCGCLACAEFILTDDGGIGLSTAGWSGTVTGGSILNCMYLEHA